MDGTPVLVRVLLFGFLVLFAAFPLALLVTLNASLWLVVLAGSHQILRAGGFGSSQSFGMARLLDRAFLGMLVVTQGIYALLCRGIMPSGLVATGLLCAIFVRGGGYALRGAGASWTSRAVMAFGCLAVAFRLTHPQFSPILSGILHIGCCCNPG